jgi:DNA-binding transcriptional ArsR family regulator
MENNKTKVTFIVHPVVEFISGLDFLANEKKYRQLFQEYHYTQDEKVKANVQLMASNVSRYLEKEITYFFNLPEISDIMGRLMIENPELLDVEAFIGYLEAMDANVLLVNILERFFIDAPSELEIIKALIKGSHQKERIFNIITRSEVTSEAVREKLLDMIESPEEIKLRLTLLLRQFYEKCYRSIETDILSTLNASKEKFENMYEADQIDFYEEYLRAHAIPSMKDSIVNISYFVQIGRWKFFVAPYETVEYISIGMHSDRYPQRSFQKIKVKKLLKLLADEKRFEMVQLLGKRSWYGHELADALHITPPTVSYHMNALMELGLVILEKESNRTYYHLDIEKLKQLLKLVEKRLFQDE